MYVRSVPVSDAHKMRVSEMFIVSTMDKEDYDNLDTIVDFSELYGSTTLETLQYSLANRSFDNLVCQDNVPAVTIKEIVNVVDVLSKRIVQV